MLRFAQHDKLDKNFRRGVPVQQATFLAYVDNFRLLAFVSLLCIPAALLLRRLRTPSGPVGAH